jgi:hypothetical protein
VVRGAGATPRRDRGTWRGAEAQRTASARRQPKGCLDAITVETFSRGQGRPAMGVLRDREAGTCSAVLAVTGGGFVLLGTRDRRDRVAAWSRLLAAIARDGTAVHRLQWVERCVPDDGSFLRRHFAESATAEAAPEALGSYAQLLDVAERDAVRHELYLVVTMREARSRSGRLPSSSDVERLGEEAASLERALRQVGAVVEGVLTPAALRAALASAFELDATPTPFRSRGESADAGAPASSRGSSPWPAAYDVEWDRFRAGSAVHASYWIAEWPRTDVSDDFLVPLVTSGAVRRTLSVTLAPVAPLRASRDAEHARTSGVADAEIRRRHGFAVTARARRDHDAVLQREAELAAGHASYRFSGYLTVTAGDPDQLARSCEVVERLAASCQLELRRLYGAQDAGFLATLPIGRGLS